MLKARIGVRMIEGFSVMDAATQEALMDEAIREYARQAGILGESVINPEKCAEALVNASFQNAKFSDRIWANQDALRSELAVLLRSGLIQGVGSRKLAADVRKRFGVSRYKAERLMRTEMARVQTGAQVDSITRNGYEHYMYIARESACPVCKPLDGTVKPIKDIRVGVNAPPMHPHCFCSIAAATEEQGEIHKIAVKHIKAVQMVEPRITESLQRIASQTNAKMAGLDFRVKTEQSLSRKIKSDAEEKSVSFKKADKQIRDVLRYTMLREENHFTDGYFRTMEALQEQGYNISRVKNTWKEGSTYKGINTIIRDGNGVEFELQFHTAKSLEVKEGGLHKLYEQYRTLDEERDAAMRARLKKQMIELSATIPNPKGIERIISEGR